MFFINRFDYFENEILLDLLVQRHKQNKCGLKQEVTRFKVNTKEMD